MRQAFKIVLITLAGIALLSSCIKDDRSGCPPPREVQTLKLTFAPPANMSTAPTQADMKVAVVYIFDSAGELFDTWTKENPALNTTYDTGIVLGQDTYRLVVWINPDTPYTITPTYTRTRETSATRSDLDDGRVTLNVPQDGDVKDEIPMLFYGSAEQVTAPVDDTTFDVPLTLNTYRITVTLKGISHDGCAYMLKITDTNGSYDFYNNFIDVPEFDYIDSDIVGTSGGTGDLRLSLNILKLDDSRAPMLSIVNTTTGKTIFPQNGAASVNLMTLIRQTGIDLATTHFIDIEVPAIPTPPTDGANVPIEVYINGWHVVIDGGYNINPYE